MRDNSDPATRPAADDLLGRTFRFRQSDGYTVMLHFVRAVGYDPERGVRLAGGTFAPAWVDFQMWDRLLDAGVLEAS